MTPANGTPTPDALRELVREVLRDVLPALAARNGSPSAAAPSSPPAPSFASAAPWSSLSAPSVAQFAPSSAPPAPSSVDGPLPTGQPGFAVPTAPPTSDPPPSRAAGTPGADGTPRTAGTAVTNGTPRTAGTAVTDGTIGTRETTGIGRTAVVGETAGTGGVAGAYDTASGVTLQPVRLATDEDLHEFVLQIVRLADNPKRRRDLVAGLFRFTLAAAGSGPGPARSGPGPAHPRAAWSGSGRRSMPVAADGGLAGASGGENRIERGAVTERAVQAAASAGARLVLGPRAVLTPLARDRARALGVPIEKER
jgi:hypothetical protein